jgi:hypothetical protein
MREILLLSPRGQLERDRSPRWWRDGSVRSALAAPKDLGGEDGSCGHCDFEEDDDHGDCFVAPAPNSLTK